MNRIAFVLCLLLSTTVTASETVPYTPPGIATESIVNRDFRSNLRKAIRNARKAGDLTAREAMRLRVATLSPAFIEQAQELAVIQMAFSGEESQYFPRTDSGGVEVENIDWSGLLDFLETIIPILLQLLLLL